MFFVSQNDTVFRSENLEIFDRSKVLVEGTTYSFAKEPLFDNYANKGWKEFVEKSASNLEVGRRDQSSHHVAVPFVILLERFVSI